MAGISNRALNGVEENRYRYNGGSELEIGELSDGSGLDMYTTKFRNYDAQIGRFRQIDVFSEMNPNFSSYTFASNNPIIFNDPYGLRDSIVNGEHVNTTGTLDEVVVMAGQKPNNSDAFYVFANIPGNFISYTSGTTIYNDWVRVMYNKAVQSNPYPDGTLSSRLYRASQKDNFRKITPQPFRSYLDHSRPIADEYKKAFQGTVNNATKTNIGANAVSKGLAKLGYLGLAYDIYNSSSSINNAKNRGLEASSQIGRFSGSIGGGTIGAEFGALVGACFGGVGAIPGSILGGLIGSWIGGEAGQQMGAGVYKQVKGNDDD